MQDRQSNISHFGFVILGVLLISIVFVGLSFTVFKLWRNRHRIRRLPHLSQLSSHPQIFIVIWSVVYLLMFLLVPAYKLRHFLRRGAIEVTGFRAMTGVWEDFAGVLLLENRHSVLDVLKQLNQWSAVLGKLVFTIYSFPMLITTLALLIVAAWIKNERRLWFVALVLGGSSIFLSALRWNYELRVGVGGFIFVTVYGALLPCTAVLALLVSSERH